MFDNILTNRYLMIALIIALIVVLFMYIQKGSCNTEGMDNVDLTPLAQELTEKPWTNREGGGDQRRVDNKFDKFADKYVRNKLKKEGIDAPPFLTRLDQKYRAYMEKHGKTNVHMDRPFYDQYEDGDFDTVIPKPLDSRPDLSQCQPCRCDDRPKRNKKWKKTKKAYKKRMDDSESDSDSD